MSRFSQKFLETHIFAPLKAKTVAANAQKKNLKQKITLRVVGSIGDVGKFVTEKRDKNVIKRMVSTQNHPGKCYKRSVFWYYVENLPFFLGNVNEYYGNKYFLRYSFRCTSLC